MGALDSFKGQHAELENMVSDLRKMMNKDQLSIKPNAMTAHKMLCDLSDKVKALLKEQDKTIYPDLLTHDDPRAKSIAWGFINGQKPLRKLFDDYYKKWLKDCDFDFTDQFLVETNDMFDALMTRIEREQTILIPKLEQLESEQLGNYSAQA